MSLGELLWTKSSEYELLAEWHGERAPLDDQHVVACQAMAVVVPSRRWPRDRGPRTRLRPRVHPAKRSSDSRSASPRPGQVWLRGSAGAWRSAAERRAPRKCRSGRR